MANILIVDHDQTFSALLSRLLLENGHTTQAVSSGEAALRVSEARPPDLILLGIDGLEILRRLAAVAPRSPTVMFSAHSSVGVAVNAMKCGAADFISKPFSNEALLSTIEALLKTRTVQPSNLIGESESFKKALDLALKFAAPEINVLLLGETGTGKEVFAKTIHAASKRRDKNFVAVDCSILSENLIESEIFGHERGAFTGATESRIGRFELAQGGTLFLDEVGNLPLDFQAKLLRVLQERRFERVGGRETIHLDVRIVAATNANLKEAIRAGKFRQDLFYRLQEMIIRIPPLRERSGDISRIAEHYLRVYSRRFETAVQGIAPSARSLLEQYEWPGNVRELESTMKSAAVLATDWVFPEHLPPELSCGSRVDHLAHNDDHLRLLIEMGVETSSVDLKAFGAMAAEQAERSLLEALMRRGRTNGTQMAKLLGVDPKTLRTKLRKYGLESGADSLSMRPGSRSSFPDYLPSTE